jgi:glycine/D-amino acid oxidase-like deaminating enzyme
MPSAVVVGAGVFGSALARLLAIEGWHVTVVEQEEPGCDASSSGGESRLIRWSHGTERWYTRSARRARELWRQVDPSLIADHGMVWFAHSDDGWEAESERVLREEGIPVERLDPADAMRMFPSLAGDDLAWVLYEPDAGVLRAGAALVALAGQAREAGARFVSGHAQPRGAGVQVGGDVLEADHVVWACGPWLPKLFPGLAPIHVTRQVVVFFDAPPEWHGVPGWVDYDRSFYGHGNLADWGFKAAPDAEGPAADPDALGPPDEFAEALARKYVAERFPALRDARVVRTRTCPYELTPDTHFVAAPHPEHPSVWLLGGGSGHGFKHAPALAEHMLGWLRGDEPPDPRFRLGAREANRSLRTAGARATPIGRRLPEAGS